MFSTTTKYVLKALAHLAHSPAVAIILGHEIGKKGGGVRLYYLSKIVLPLRDSEFVDVTRGLGDRSPLETGRSDFTEGSCEVVQ